MNENQDQIREAAELLGLDFAKLSAGGRLRCELVAALRAVVDDALTKVTRGSATDLAKLVTATEALTGLLKESPAAAQELDPEDDGEDPRESLMRIIDGLAGRLRGRGIRQTLGSRRAPTSANHKDHHYHDFTPRHCEARRRYRARKKDRRIRRELSRSFAPFVGLVGFWIDWPRGEISDFRPLR